MDYPKFIASNQKGDSISIQRANPAFGVWYLSPRGAAKAKEKHHKPMY